MTHDPCTSVSINIYIYSAYSPYPLGRWANVGLMFEFDFIVFPKSGCHVKVVMG